MMITTTARPSTLVSSFSVSTSAPMREKSRGWRRLQAVAR